MNLAPVKLVVFDMDGTLLNDAHQVSPEFYEQFQMLNDKGVHFAAASGRQLQSIRNTLYPIKDKISIIAENGGVLQHGQHLKTLLSLEVEQVKTCIEVLRKIQDCYIVLCGKRSAYIEQNNPEFLQVFKNYYHEARHVNDLTAIADDDFLKIAVFHFQSSEQYIFPFVKELTHEVKVIVSAKHWLDISPLHSNKAYALELLQKQIGVCKQETMVFGDYKNDLEMLKLGNFSFAMANAHPEVKALANYETKSNNNLGVECVLEILNISKQNTI